MGRPIGTGRDEAATARARRFSSPENIHRLWDQQRAKARTPSELAEIDAIFARHC